MKMGTLSKAIALIIIISVGTYWFLSLPESQPYKPIPTLTVNYPSLINYGDSVTIKALFNYTLPQMFQPIEEFLYFLNYRVYLIKDKTLLLYRYGPTGWGSVKYGQTDSNGMISWTFIISENVTSLAYKVVYDGGLLFQPAESIEMAINVFSTPPPSTIKYSLTIQSAIGGDTTPIAGTYSYDNGTIVNVYANASVGYEFYHWLVNGTENYNNPLSLVMTDNYVVTPVFSLQSPVAYTITVDSAIGGTTSPPAGTYTVYTGESFAIINIADTNYVFKYWIVNGLYNTSQIYSITNVQMDYRITPVFELISEQGYGQLYIKSRALADFNGDGLVDSIDNSILKEAFGSTPDSANWNPLCDINGDNKVDSKDQGYFSVVYGTVVEGVIYDYDFANSVWKEVWRNGPFDSSEKFIGNFTGGVHKMKVELWYGPSYKEWNISDITFVKDTKYLWEPKLNLYTVPLPNPYTLLPFFTLQLTGDQANILKWFGLIVSVSSAFVLIVVLLKWKKKLT